MTDNLDSILTKGAPIAGALISLKFVKGTWDEKMLMFAGGAALSFYASPYVSMRTGLPEGFTGFGLGLFGMAVCAKGYELIQGLPIREVWDRILNKIAS
jgi:hypothetical protein